jgi:hypothetical protein
MEILYKNILEDAIAFNEYHQQNSKTFRRHRRRALIYLPIILLVVALAASAHSGNWWVLISIAVFTALYAIIMHRSQKTGLHKTLKKLYEEEDTTGFFCKHRLVINDEEIVETTDVSERKDRWVGVSKIAVEDDYAFIYIGPLQAHIIPRKGLLEGDFDAFVEAAVNYREEAVRRAAMN